MSLIQYWMLNLCEQLFHHLFNQALDISVVRFSHLKPGKRGQQVIGEGSDHRGALGWQRWAVAHAGNCSALASGQLRPARCCSVHCCTYNQPVCPPPLTTSTGFPGRENRLGPSPERAPTDKSPSLQLNTRNPPTDAEKDLLRTNWVLDRFQLCSLGLDQFWVNKHFYVFPVSS